MLIARFIMRPPARRIFPARALSRIAVAAANTSAVLLVSAVSLLAQEVAHEQLSGLQFRHIGPVGNRLASVVGVPGDRSTYYAGAASGGIWRTEDAGAQLGAGVR